jgi:hypothetical protein
MPLHGFTAVDLGYQQGNAVSNFVNKMDEPVATRTFLALFDQIWQDAEKLTDVTELIRDHIASVYKENSPQRIYFLMLFSIFSEFLQDISEDVLPNERTGYQESTIWQKLYSFQRDAATGIINKQRLHSGRQRRAGKDLYRPGGRQVLRAAQSNRARPVPEEARRQLDDI